MEILQRLGEKCLLDYRLCNQIDLNIISVQKRVENRTLYHLANQTTADLFFYIERYASFYPEVTLISLFEIERRGDEIPQRLILILEKFVIKNGNVPINKMKQNLLMKMGFRSYLEYYDSEVQSIENYRIKQEEAIISEDKSIVSIVDPKSIIAAGESLKRVAISMVLGIIVNLLFVGIVFGENHHMSFNELKFIYNIMISFNLIIGGYSIYSLYDSGDKLTNI